MRVAPIPKKGRKSQKTTQDQKVHVLFLNQRSGSDSD